jgi:hypothetical protein
MVPVIWKMAWRLCGDAQTWCISIGRTCFTNHRSYLRTAPSGHGARATPRDDSRRRHDRFPRPPILFRGERGIGSPLCAMFIVRI